MQTSLSKQTIGCIGKCTSGLSHEELDQITDNINKTLAHPRGREIFRKYLKRRDLRDNLECLTLYETCCEFIDEEQILSKNKKESSLESLIENVTKVKEMAEDLDGVPQIDMALLERFNEALNSDSRTALLGVLVDTRDRSRDHLRRVHENFKNQRMVISVEEYMTRINNIRDTVTSLEESLMISRSLEAERWLRYSNLKTKNKAVMDDLKKANKRNKNMLNLFRQSVTDIRLGSEIALPESLKREVQRTWHQKYDTLLMQNEKLKQEVTAANSLIKEKIQEIDSLQQKLLTLGDRLVERNEAVEKICKKYLNLKKRRDEQEILLRGSIETLQDALNKASNATTNKNAEVSPTPSKDALLARERRRSDRLAYENSRLRVLLQEAKRGCKTSGSSSIISFEKTT